MAKHYAILLALVVLQALLVEETTCKPLFHKLWNKFSKKESKAVDTSDDFNYGTKHSGSVQNPQNQYKLYPVFVAHPSLTPKVVHQPVNSFQPQLETGHKQHLTHGGQPIVRNPEWNQRLNAEHRRDSSHGVSQNGFVNRNYVKNVQPGPIHPSANVGKAQLRPIQSQSNAISLSEIGAESHRRNEPINFIPHSQQSNARPANQGGPVPRFRQNAEQIDEFSTGMTPQREEVQSIHPIGLENKLPPFDPSFDMEPPQPRRIDVSQQYHVAGDANIAMTESNKYSYGSSPKYFLPDMDTPDMDADLEFLEGQRKVTNTKPHQNSNTIPILRSGIARENFARTEGRVRRRRSLGDQLPESLRIKDNGILEITANETLHSNSLKFSVLGAIFKKSPDSFNEQSLKTIKRPFLNKIKNSKSSDVVAHRNQMWEQEIPVDFLNLPIKGSGLQMRKTFQNLKNNMSMASLVIDYDDTRQILSGIGPRNAEVLKCSSDGSKKPFVRRVTCGHHYLELGDSVVLKQTKPECRWHFTTNSDQIFFNIFSNVKPKLNVTRGQNYAAVKATKTSSMMIPQDYFIVDALETLPPQTFSMQICLKDAEPAIEDKEQTLKDYSEYSAPNCGILPETPEMSTPENLVLPWQVFIDVYSNIWPLESPPQCAGVLISDTMVLTRASCFSGILSPNASIAFTDEEMDSHPCIRQIDFSPPALASHDLALLTLTKPSTCTPVCLPQNDDLNRFLGERQTVAAFVKEDRKLVDYEVIEEEIVSREKCDLISTEAHQRHVFCSLKTDRKKPCLTDPFVFAEEDSRCFLIGSPAGTGDENCLKRYRTYTSIPHFMDYIENVFTGTQLY